MTNVMGDCREPTEEQVIKSELCIATDLDDIEKNGIACSTLLSVLDDKNKAIAHLQQQIQNQKVQLSYYLRKGLNNAKIKELSKTCATHAVDDNIQLTLAMNNFYKEHGFKSKLVIIHDRMAYIDEKIQAILQHQESLIREIVNKLLSCRKPNDAAIKHRNIGPTRFVIDARSLNMFNCLLRATVNLGKELETFRTCCNRLILIEDERNILVEQVYSMPVQQRTQCNQMMALHSEKRQLDKEMVRIREEQANLEKKLKCLRLVQQKVKEFYDSGNSTEDPAESTQLCRLLDTVKSDALSLLTITREQKQKYESDVSRLREENEMLKANLATMGSVMKEKCALAEQVARLEAFVKATSEADGQQQNNELELCKEQLAAVTEERNSLRNALSETSMKLTQLVDVIQTRTEEIEKLKEERDGYKSQVEDLEAIRNAYSQLIDYQDNAQMDNTEKNRKIEALESQRDELSETVKKLRQETQLQEQHIKQLLFVIEKLELGKEDQQQVVSTATGNSTSAIDKHVATSIDPSFSEHSDEETHLIAPLSDEMKIIHENTLKEIFPVNETDRNQYEELPVPEFGSGDVVSRTNFFAADQEVEMSRKKEPGKKSSKESVKDPPKRPMVVTTSFEVHSVDKQGRQESVKAILESTAPVEGTIKMDEKNRVCLNLKYTNVSEDIKEMKSAYTDFEVLSETSSAVCRRPDINELDEDELMRDCSDDNVPTIEYFKQLEAPTSLEAAISLDDPTSLELVEAPPAVVIIEPPECFLEEPPTYEEPSNVRRNYSKMERVDIATICALDEMEISDALSKKSIEVRSTPDVLRPHNRRVKFISCANLVRSEEVTETSDDKVLRRNSLTTQVKMIASNLDKKIEEPEAKQSVIDAIEQMYKLCTETEN